MAFQHCDENDLVYPNLVNCQISASNALIFAKNDALPPPPPPFSTASAQSLLSKPPLDTYDFNVEKQVLAREQKGAKTSASRSLNSSEIEQGSVEVTLSDLERTS